MSNYISIQSSNDVIEHFGTKGMRWGHRKSKEFYTKKYINKGYHPRHARIDKQFNQIDDLLRDLSGGGSRRGANGRRIKDVTDSLRG